MENKNKHTKKKLSKEAILNIILVGLASIFLIIFFINQAHTNHTTEEAMFNKQPQNEPVYVKKLFDDSYVHKVKIIIPEDKWQQLQETALEKKYFDCDVEIDGELIQNVAVRTKGRTTLRLVDQSGKENHSFKIEFDHNVKGLTYHGLDKLVLNSSVCDDTFVRNYIAHDMMRFLGVPAPYTSFVNVYVNDTDMGLYLGIEAIEEAFMERNYGKDYGELYEVSDSDYYDKLNYKGDNIEEYSRLLGNDKTDPTDEDKQRMVEAVKYINSGELDKAVNVDEVIRLFIADNFLCHYEGYFGFPTHNYYLAEKDGILEMLPWDFDGIYYFNRVIDGMISDEDMHFILLNMPLVDRPLVTPLDDDRILWRQIISNDEYKKIYYDYYNEFLKEYFDSGYFENKMDYIYDIIYPYLDNDQNVFHSTGQFVGCFGWLENLMIEKRNTIQDQLDGKFSEEDKEKVITLLTDATPSYIAYGK